MISDKLRKLDHPKPHFLSETERTIRDNLARDIAEFLARGGEIDVVPFGASSDESAEVSRDKHGRLRYREKNLHLTRINRQSFANREAKRQRVKPITRRGPFTEEQVREIRASGESGKALAERFGVHVNTISKVRQGLSYGWVI